MGNNAEKISLTKEKKVAFLTKTSKITGYEEWFMKVNVQQSK